MAGAPRSQISIEMTADELKAFNAYQRIIEQQAKVISGGKKVEQQFNKSGRAFKSSLKNGAKNLSSVATGWVSVASAVGLATAAFQKLEAQRDKAAGKIKAESFGGRARLAQIASTTGDGPTFQQLIKVTEQLYKAGATATMDEAANTVFALQSAGQLGEIKTFAKLGGVVPQLDVLANAVSALQKAVGRAETGGAQALISKGFAASNFAPASVDELLLGASRAGGQAALLGVSDEELLAGTTLLSGPTGNAAEAGTQLKSFLTALIKKGGFEGKSINDAVKEINAKGLTNAELVRFFGRAEALGAYVQFRDNADQFNAIMSDVIDAQKTDLIGQKVRALRSDSTFAVGLIDRKASATRELAEEKEGRKRLMADALQEATAAVLKDRGEYGMGAAVSEVANDILQRVPGFGDDFVIGNYLKPETDPQANRARKILLQQANKISESDTIEPTFSENFLPVESFGIADQIDKKTPTQDTVRAILSGVAEIGEKFKTAAESLTEAVSGGKILGVPPSEDR